MFFHYSESHVLIIYCYVTDTSDCVALSSLLSLSSVGGWASAEWFLLRLLKHGCSWEPAGTEVFWSLGWTGHPKWLTNGQQLLLLMGTLLPDSLPMRLGFLTASALGSEWAHPNLKSFKIAGSGSCQPITSYLQNWWSHLRVFNWPKVFTRPALIQGTREINPMS